MFVSALLIVFTMASCGSLTQSKEPLSILFLSTPMPGHITPVLAFGEELVRRGHHVTLCTTVLAGSKLTETKAQQAGVEFFSAGESYFVTYDEYQQSFENLASGNMTTFLKVIYLGPEESKRIGLKIDHPNISRFDIIVATELLAPLTACLTKKWNLYGMVVSTTFQIQPPHLPPWPFPPYMANRGERSLCSTDNMSFMDRVLTLPYTIVFSTLWKLSVRSTLYYSGSTDCSMIQSDYAALFPGVFAPQVVQTSIGFEYPRLQLPLSHYVGPLLSKNTPAVPNHLQTWLDSKQNRSVVLVSMGSTVALSDNHAKAIVEATVSTGHSLLWSLRRSNQHILRGLPISSDQVKILEWLPQLSVIKHPSIAMAILHGGLNSVNEALYHKVPVIAVPFVNDQGDVAARLNHSRAGIMLLREDLQVDKLTMAINSIEAGVFDTDVDRVYKTLRFVGGVDTAADLVELYCRTGYDHLVPAYARYNWKWIAYYNLDVYLCLLPLFSMVLYLFYKMCCCLLHRSTCK